MEDKVYLFDTTLRDGQQTTGVNFSVSDKMNISQHLKMLGYIHFITNRKINSCCLLTISKCCIE